MRINTEKGLLLEKLQPLQNIINPRLSLPILSNVLLEAEKDNLRLATTDLDIGILSSLNVNVVEEGGITLHAKRFYEIIRELPEGKIEIIVRKNNSVVIEAENCHFRIIGQPKEEFPKLPSFKNKEIFKVEQSLLKKILNLTSFAMSHEETRYILNGILLEIEPHKEENILKMVSLDGRRLAFYQKQLDMGLTKNIKIIIPAKTIYELNRNLKDEGFVNIAVGDNQVLFEIDSMRIISRLLEGEYPNYTQVIPKEADVKIWIERHRFISTLKRAALLSTPDYQATKFEIFKSKIVVNKSTPDLGELREEIPIEYGGKEFIIGFNPDYFLDVLKNLDQDKISIELTEPGKPGTFRTPEYLHVVLPIEL